MDRKLLPDSEIGDIPEIQSGIPSDRGAKILLRTSDPPTSRSRGNFTIAEPFLKFEGLGVMGGLFPAPHLPIIDPWKTLPGRTSNMMPAQHNYSKSNTAGCRCETNAEVFYDPPLPGYQLDINLQYRSFRFGSGGVGDGHWPPYIYGH